MDTEETKQNTVEETTVASERSGKSASTQAAEASEAGGGGKTPITDTPAFKAALEERERHWQSVTDKNTKDLKNRLDMLERERKAEREARESQERQQREEAQINETYQGLIDEGASETAAMTWRDKALKLSRDLAKKGAEHNEAVKKRDEEYTTKSAELTGKTLKLAIADVQEEAEKQGKFFSYSDAKAIAEESEGNSKMIHILVKGAPLAEKEEDDDTERPGSSLSATPGGVNWHKLSPKEKIDYSLSKEK